jgi:hypothetical protein
MHSLKVAHLFRVRSKAAAYQSTVRHGNGEIVADLSLRVAVFGSLLTFYGRPFCQMGPCRMRCTDDRVAKVKTNRADASVAKSTRISEQQTAICATGDLHIAPP